MLERPVINTEIAQAVTDALHHQHRTNAGEPLRAPGDLGSWADLLALHGEALTVVLDANVLRDDILYACRWKKRTTLLTAANTGALRLYAAQQVVREVHRDAEKWCAGGYGDPTTFRAGFREEYLPRIQVIPDDAIPLTVLSPQEIKRVDKLARATRYGTPDVPSAVLSLALGAPFLSTDEAASEAVYGSYRPYPELEKWRATLTAAGDASELAKLNVVAIGAPMASSYGVFKGAQYLITRAPLLAAALGAGALVGALFAPKTLYAAVGSAGKRLLEGYYEIGRLYQSALDQFHAAAPPRPSWEELRAVIGDRDLLLRVSLHTLAHAPKTNLSANALAEELPPLGVAQSAATVRRLLRTNPSFSRYGKYQWRVGHTFGYRTQDGTKAL